VDGNLKIRGVKGKTGQMVKNVKSNVKAISDDRYQNELIFVGIKYEFSNFKTSRFFCVCNKTRNFLGSFRKHLFNKFSIIKTKEVSS
jgi:hypothetical protein